MWLPGAGKLAGPRGWMLNCERMDQTGNELSQGGRLQSNQVHGKNELDCMLTGAISGHCCTGSVPLC